MEGLPASPACLCFVAHDDPALFCLPDPCHVDGGGRIGDGLIGAESASASGRGVGVDGNVNAIANGRGCGCDGCGGVGDLNRGLLASIALRVSRAMALLLCRICGS
jgi:hypothetical protein